MSYVTESTVWLSDGISQDIRDLIARFYELADSRQSNAGPLMASEVFTHDGIFKSSTGAHTGAEGMSWTAPHVCVWLLTPAPQK